MNTKNVFKNRLVAFLFSALLALGQATQAAPFFGRCGLKSVATETYSRADAARKIVATQRGIGSRELFYVADAGDGQVALQNCTTGFYLRVLANAPRRVEASAEDAADRATRFIETDLGGGFYAFKSVSSGRYLRVAGKADGFVWRADGGVNAERDDEKFLVDPCQVDVWKALTAFATHFPNKVKVKSSENPPAQMRLTAEMLQSGTHYWYQVIEDHRFDKIGHPVYDRNVLKNLGGWECWVITGTLPQFQSGANWVEGIPRTRRYCDATVQQDSPHQQVHWRDIALDCSEKQVAVGDEWGRRYIGEMKDLSVGRGNSQIDMGKRWVLRVSYKDAQESWIIDLGPQIGVFDPQYGTVAYVNGDGVFLWFNNVQNAYDVNPKRCPKY